jgi:hypothetical protein
MAGTRSLWPRCQFSLPSGLKTYESRELGCSRFGPNGPGFDVDLPAVQATRAAPIRQTTETMQPPKLAALDRKSVAIELVVRGTDRLLFGHGVYEPDDEQGSRLRITSSCSAGYDIELHERSWNGAILSGKPYGCDFLLRIA